MRKINVTKTFLPPIGEYEEYLSRIWASNLVTNQGPLVKTLENELQDYLNVQKVHFVANGTLALQLALRALNITDGEIITTPFSYVATTSAILWEHCHPIYVDIDPTTFCIDADKIEAAITPNTKAIMPVHVYGRACDVEKIDAIAKRHNLKVIYDGAHAFGVKYKGKYLLSYGDVSTCSFHATKLFHTIEGGCIIAKDKMVSDKVELIKRFGHNQDDHFILGINAKASEFHAAMGLCNLKYVRQDIATRKTVTELYDKLLDDKIQKPAIAESTDYNYAYYPVVLASETRLANIMERLKDENIFPRRYFYPSLNKLPYLKSTQSCPISEDIAGRVLCLPLYAGLKEEDVNKICGILNK